MHILKPQDQKQMEEIYNSISSTENKEEVKEGISGVYPQMSMAQEFGGAVLMAALIFLPFLLEKIRMRLTGSQLENFAKEVVKFVKSDTSKDSLKMKISRAANTLIQKLTKGNVDSVQQDVLNVLPDNIEKKTKEEVSAETKAKLADLKKHVARHSFRG
jgi:hypothetical protein